MRTLRFIFFILVLPLHPAFASQTDTNVLMLISGYGTEEQPQLSYDLEELAQAYLVLHDNGVNIDIATPKGGPVLVKSNKDDLAFIQRFKSVALSQLNNTRASETVDPNHYQGIFIVGGAGAMFDLPSDSATQAMLTRFAAKHKMIAAVCHGPAAIADVRLPDGQHLVAGRQVNAFTNTEEHAFSGEHIAAFPFLVEDKLIENGGIFVHNDPMLPFVVIDENLITAQNPSSVPKAAEALLVKLGITPKPRVPFKDEATMQLVATAKQTGVVAIDIALAKNPDNYDMNYLALYGFYAYALAGEEDKVQELDVMVAIARYFQHPAYESALIKALHEQNQYKQARRYLNAFVERYPSHDQAATLSALLNDNTQR
ncbi:type 1 glutamine amidotransferase domain-containing protein [Alteromonas halophila]|uniref:DJ-1/PfpI domain-containing protein n=1 Tax=Alteromonas halophila TaxID=516698 RepID=A0A918JFG5_9ALTE|nr:type 1 glutamine amidotransferase domain-containing protein [Alteromonas halophila]GGW76191.1 hypothetical protein GCM10007391_05890 [Alteromonas halophila]